MGILHLSTYTYVCEKCGEKTSLKYWPNGTAIRQYQIKMNLPKNSEEKAIICPKCGNKARIYENFNLECRHCNENRQIGEDELPKNIQKTMMNRAFKKDETAEEMKCPKCSKTAELKWRNEKNYKY